MAPRTRTVTVLEGDSKAARREIAREVLKHPVRQRLLVLLRLGEPRTQSQMGKALALSNAKVHYHMKLLVGSGLAEFKGTRPGPNGITEKLYASSPAVWRGLSDRPVQDDCDHMLDYTTGWIQEGLREGVEVVKRDWQAAKFLAGSRLIYATDDEIRDFARQLDKLVGHFCRKERRAPRKGAKPYAVAHSIFPTLAKAPMGAGGGVFDWRLVTPWPPKKG